MTLRVSRWADDLPGPRVFTRVHTRQAGRSGMHEERCEDRAEVAVEARPCARKAAASLEAEKRKETDSVPEPGRELCPADVLI